jgi:hypothetical protein
LELKFAYTPTQSRSSLTKEFRNSRAETVQQPLAFKKRNVGGGEFINIDEASHDSTETLQVPDYMLFSVSKSKSPPSPIFPAATKSLATTSFSISPDADAGGLTSSMQNVKEKDGGNPAKELDVCLTHIKALVAEIEAVQTMLRNDGGQNTLVERKATLSQTYKIARSKLDVFLLPEEAEKASGLENKVTQTPTSTTGNKLVSPASRPKISPDLNLIPDYMDILLSTKSNYPNIIDVTQAPGVSYPSSLAANLTSKRTSQKLGEQGRRNRINTALAEMETLLPKPAPGTNERGKANENGSSKATTVEAAIRYIKMLQKQVHGDESVEGETQKPHVELPQAKPENFDPDSVDEAAGDQTPRISPPPFEHLNFVPRETFTLPDASFTPLVSPALTPQLQNTSGAYFSPLTSPGLELRHQDNECSWATYSLGTPSLATFDIESDSALVLDMEVESVQTRSGRRNAVQTRSGRINRMRNSTKDAYVCSCGKVSICGSCLVVALLRC